MPPWPVATRPAMAAPPPRLPAPPPRPSPEIRSHPRDPPDGEAARGSPAPRGLRGTPRHPLVRREVFAGPQLPLPHGVRVGPSGTGGSEEPPLPQPPLPHPERAISLLCLGARSLSADGTGRCFLSRAGGAVLSPRYVRALGRGSRLRGLRRWKP